MPKIQAEKMERILDTNHSFYSNASIRIWVYQLLQDKKLYENTPQNEIRENQTIVGIMPEMILVFLDDLLNTINNPMIKRLQDIKMKFGRD